MKIEISVSPKIFELSESLAKRLKVSRSKIFAMGIEKLNEKLAEEIDKAEITKKINDFYAKYTAEDVPDIRIMATRSFERNEW